MCKRTIFSTPGCAACGGLRNAAARENDELAKEKREIEGLLGDEAKQWKAIAAQIRELKKKYGPDTKIGRRRTSFGEPPDIANVISRER